ncbi:ABL068Cp [Eremothecium gossypii ATCC 10895]|uniref:ABL068Cp n=1 Tax=Eremothecium gossypii (strain ATCC 10895 / CBS 109.51 / FGSC 9923 / NRRL Y-1056) TaxID=284811 RepID=Q75DU1_EREGS|nr:ABL068Cp [Eremothecium gossypii ATCC 10895]AAS50703.2 ABL068Cp [Eremothecium gossypii ATCC 10895]AEY94991.1 FABL068Cp [Eremothecium gossypii FDAG1]
MDLSILLQCFSGTLSHDAAVRSNAEKRLKEYSGHIGFLGACLDIMGSSEVSENIKLSASLYFKNKITYGWSGKGHGKNELLEYTVDPDERPVVRELLVKALTNCSQQAPSCMRVLQLALAEIVSVEYPAGRWDGLLEASFGSLASGDMHAAHVGLLCAMEVFRTYRWKENDERQELEMLIMRYFPDLLHYANALLYSEEKHNEIVGNMLKLVLKIYKFVTYNDLPFTLQRSENFIPWANFHVSVIQSQLPEHVMALAVDDRRAHPWVRAKKWAYANMYRLFQRYASESLSKKFEYTEFKMLYVEQFLPQLLQLHFQQIERWGAGELWLSKESLYYILEFIEQTVVQKSTWPIVDPHYATILEHVIFPLLCPSEETLESFEVDPQEYVHRNLEAWDADYSPDVAAVSLLVTAVKKRSKTTLEPTVQFVSQMLQHNTVSFADMTLEQAVKVESCLRIVSSILDRLFHAKSPYTSEMEGFLTRFVFPLFHSKYGFLRARVCEVCSKLDSNMLKQKETLQTIYQGVVKCFNEEPGSLPVQLLAALALQAFINIPDFHSSLSAIVVPTMQKLLQLSSEFESDTISGVMQQFVESFATELQPFGVELMNNLVQQFLKLAIEFHEASNFDINGFSTGELPDESDKHMAALGILSTTISILLSFENSGDIVKNLEQSFYPAAEFILKNYIEDFYREACEFVENSTFLLREITPISWKILELIGECNEKEGSMVSFYLEDFMLAINNYIIYGKNELKQNSFYSTILFKIYAKAITVEDNGFTELKQLYDLSQKMVLSLGETTSKEYVNQFLTDAVNSIISEKDSLEKCIAFGVTTFGVILSCLLYFPYDTLQFLHSKNVSLLYFQIWFDNYIPSYKRVYDIKLSLMALLSMLSHLSVEQFASCGLEPVLKKMGSTISGLFERYPVAIKELKDKRAEFTSDADFGEGLIDSDWDDEIGEDGLENEQNYLEMLRNETDVVKFINGEPSCLEEDMDDLEEDPLSGSVLDDINVYAIFQTVFSTLQQNDSTKYQLVLENMSQDEQMHLAHITSL